MNITIVQPLRTKSFGAVKALDGVSVQFDSGMIHGLIGRTGSGKTLLIKCICALMTPASGRTHNHSTASDVFLRHSASQQRGRDNRSARIFA